MVRVESRRLPRYARAAAIVAIGLLLTAAAIPGFNRTWAEGKTPDDFHVVYLGARAMLDHAEIHAATNGMYIYSPLLAFVFQPLALLPERVAALVWLVLIAIITVTATIIASRKITGSWQFAAQDVDGSMPLLVSAGALLLSFEKIRSEFILGQTDCLILLGLALILVWLDQRPQLAAVTAGIFANFKYLALIFVPYFVIKRNYRAAITLALSFAFFFMLPAIEIGGRLIGDYIVNAVAVLEKVIGGRGFAEVAPAGGVPVVNSVAWSNSVSLSSSIFRLTKSLQLSSAVAVIVITLLFIAIAGAILWIGRRYDVYLFRPVGAKAERAQAKTINIEWAALIVLALIFGPQTTARHMIMLTLVYVVGLTLVFVEQRRGPRISLLAAMVATAAALSLPFRETGVHPALLALKSAGAASWCAVVLMFFITVIGAKRKQKLKEEVDAVRC